MEGIERGPGRKGLRKDRDECRDLVKKKKKSHPDWKVEGKDEQKDGK